MRPQPLLVCVPALCAAAIGCSAFGQMTLISAERGVYAAAGRSGSPPIESTQSFSEFGSWSAEVTSGSSYASQTSDIRADGMDFDGAAGSGGGAGHFGQGRTWFNVDFMIDSPMRWSITRAYWDQFPAGAVSLSRLGESFNHFSGVDWYASSTVTASGFIDAGTYRLSIVMDFVNAGRGMRETDAFAIAVPAPGTFTLLLVLPVALRRRRSPKLAA